MPQAVTKIVLHLSDNAGLIGPKPTPWTKLKIKEACPMDQRCLGGHHPPVHHAQVPADELAPQLLPPQEPSHYLAFSQ